MSKPIVIKIGTSSLSSQNEGLKAPLMKSLVDQIAHLRQHHERVVVVTSGSIACGRHLLKTTGGKSIPEKQMFSSIGQPRLMQAWQEHLTTHNILSGQVLLTKQDFNNRTAYLNIRNTLDALLEHGVLPIINENDTVRTNEIKLGDNDTLSALVANLLGAKLLILLTDKEGLYESHPEKNKDAKLIKVVETIDAELVKLAGGAEAGSVGTGGMATKVEAARLAVESGTPVVIAKADVPDVVIRIVQGEPLGTKFLSHTSTKESRKRWLLSEAAKGVITVDKGAKAKLINEGASLLPVGIKGVLGNFKRGQVVKIVSEDGERLGLGITNYSDEEIQKIQGARSSEIEKILGYTFGPEVIHRDNLVALK